MMLPNHSKTTQVFPDVMHTVKDCIEKVFLSITGKTNLEPIIKCKTSMGRFSLSHKRKHTSTSKKAVELPYVLNAEKIKLADKRSKSIIMSNSDFNPGCTFYRTKFTTMYWTKMMHSINNMMMCIVITYRNINIII